MNKTPQYGRRAELVIEAVPTGLLVVNRAGVITLANTSATKLFGYERADLVGQPVEILLPPSLWASHAEKRTGFPSNMPTYRLGMGRDLLAVRRDGSEAAGRNRVESH